MEDLKKLEYLQEDLNTMFFIQYVLYAIFSLTIANFIIFYINPLFLEDIFNLLIAEIIASFICFSFTYITFPLIKNFFSKSKVLFLKDYDKNYQLIKSKTKTLSEILNEYDFKK